MLKSSLFGRKKTTASKPFAEFYNDWFTTLKTTLLPNLTRALSSFSVSPDFLSDQIAAVHHHFNSYYTALDQAAAADPSQCLYPDWRNSLEKPFLWLGDFHPYFFTNLLRSFLDDRESSQEDDDDGNNFLELDMTATAVEDITLDRPWPVTAAWRSPSRALTTRVDQIECGLRLMVPALAARVRHAQGTLVKNLGVEWGNGGGVAAAMEESVAAEMEELVGVVVDANRLRRSVLADVLGVANVYQAAVFLEAVAQFLVGFRDEKLLQEFERCEKPIN